MCTLLLLSSGGGTDLQLEGAVSGRLGIGADLGVARIRTRMRTIATGPASTTPAFTAPAVSRLGWGARLRATIPLVPHARLFFGTQGLAWRQGFPGIEAAPDTPPEDRWFGRVSVSTGMQWRLGKASDRLATGG